MNINSKPRDYSKIASDAKSRAIICSFIAAFFNQAPVAEMVSKLRSLPASSLLSLDWDESISPEIRGGMEEIERFIEKSKDSPDDEVRIALSRDWVRLFRGVSQGYGPPPPYEGVYRSKDGVGLDIISEINEKFTKNGVRLGENVFNRPDYIGLEFDFLGYLAECECKYWIQGREKEAQEVSHNYQSFFHEHIESWVNRYCEEAKKEAETLFYRALIKITQEFVNGV